MKEFVEATKEEDLCLIEPSFRAIGSQIYKKKHRNMSRNAINAKDSPQTYTNQNESLIPYLALGHLPNGARILSVLSPKQQGRKGIYWSARTISPNGQKQNPWRISKTLMPKSFSGKTSSPSSRSLVLSSRTMGFNLLANPSRDIAVIWGLRIGTPPQLTPREMVKPKLLTKSQ